jgi:hypothetical protein
VFGSIEVSSAFFSVCSSAENLWREHYGACTTANKKCHALKQWRIFWFICGDYSRIKRRGLDQLACLYYRRTSMRDFLYDPQKTASFYWKRCEPSFSAYLLILWASLAVIAHAYAVRENKYVFCRVQNSTVPLRSKITLKKRTHPQTITKGTKRNCSRWIFP